MKRLMFCVIVVASLSSCGQSRPYSYFCIDKNTPFDVRKEISDRTLAKAEALGASSKVTSRKAATTECKFEDRKSAVRLSITAPAGEDLEILLEEERSFYFPADAGDVYNGEYLSELYIEFERDIIDIIPDDLNYIATRAFSDDTIPRRNLRI